MRRKRVLIIDDDPMFSQSLGAVLEAAAGYEVHIARSGAAGIRKAQEIRPDVLFCDVMMPMMDGGAVVRRLQSEPDLADMKVVMITSLVGESEASLMGLDSGELIFVSKNSGPDVWLRAVESESVN